MTEHPVPSVPKAVRQTREDQGMTLEALADALGVTRQAVWLWENGERLPNTDLVVAWLSDERPWVRGLARTVLAAKYHVRVIRLPEPADPPAPESRKD